MVVSPRVSTLPRRETIIVPQTRRVMSSMLFSQRGGWAKEKPVMKAISVAILAESSTVFLLPIVEGMP